MIPEFSRFLDTNLLSGQKEPLVFSAIPQECAAIAKRFDILSLQDFESNVHVIPLEGDPFLRFNVQMKAHLVQACSVSLQEIKEEVNESFSILLSHTEPSLDEHDPDEDEVIFVGDNGFLDIGEILVQYLSLFINPYPRCSEAKFEGPEDDVKKNSLFETLKDLKLP